MSDKIYHLIRGKISGEQLDREGDAFDDGEPLTGFVSMSEEEALSHIHKNIDGKTKNNTSEIATTKPVR